MAKQIQAVQAFSPRIKRTGLAKFDHLVNFINNRTGTQKSTIRGVLYELEEALKSYLSNGHAVNIPSLGTFAPKINLKGDIGLRYWASRDIVNFLNTPEVYQNEIILNEDMIGKSTEDLIAKWNGAYPDDPVDEKPEKPTKPKK